MFPSRNGRRVNGAMGQSQRVPLEATRHWGRPGQTPKSENRAPTEIMDGISIHRRLVDLRGSRPRERGRHEEKENGEASHASANDTQVQCRSTPCLSVSKPILCHCDALPVCRRMGSFRRTALRSDAGSETRMATGHDGAGLAELNSFPRITPLPRRIQETKWRSSEGRQCRKRKSTGKWKCN